MREETRATLLGFLCSRFRLEGENFHPFASHTMSVDTGQPLTILRVKRKRNEEPVDALVFSDSKRRKKGLDVFHFIQTVEREDSWNTEDFQVSPLVSPSRPHLSTQPGTSLCACKNRIRRNRSAVNLVNASQVRQGSDHYKNVCYHQTTPGHRETTTECTSKGCLT